MSAILLVTVIVEITIIVVLFNVENDDIDTKDIKYVSEEEMKKIKVADL